MRCCIGSVLLLAAMAVGLAGAEVVTISSVDAFKQIAWARDTSAVVLFHAKWAKKACKEARAAMIGLDAARAKLEAFGKFTIAEVDAADAAVAPVARNYTIDHFPSIVLFAHVHSARVVLFNGHAHSTEAILEWVDTTLERHSKYKASEDAVNAHREARMNNYPHPAPGQVVALKTVEEFRRISGDSAKTVFVAFTAPWCQYCKELEPILAQVAQHYKGDSKTVVARVNGDDMPALVEKLGMEGFPTLRVFPKGVHAKGKGLKFEGERDLHTIGNFLDLHNSNVPIDGVEYPFSEDDEL
jgi:thioredoxin-like negative regulator of GroEL